MEKMTISSSLGTVMYPNNRGQHKQQVLVFDLTGEVRRADKVPYNVGSDLPELNMSIKSERFTLMSANLCKSQDKRKIVKQFFAECISELFAYVCVDCKTVYIMTPSEFRTFINKFCKMERESGVKRKKLRMGYETQTVMQWLEKRATATAKKSGG